MTQRQARDFGAMLRAAREARGITLGEIAESTKISTGILEALEANDVSTLPGGIFARSFVRSYATAVDLDPEEALQSFLEAFPKTDVAQGSSYADQGDELDQSASQRLMVRTAIGLFVLSVPVAALLVFLGLGDPTDTEPPTPEAIMELGPPRAAGPGEPGGRDRESAGALARGAADGPPLLIDIHPREACWVSLTLDGERVFSRVMQPGEHEVHEADRDIVLSVGNAGVFNFSINQQQGQSLGAIGEVVTAHIDRDNFRRFVVQQAGTSPDATSH